MDQDPPFRQIGIVGTGRVAGALAHSLRAQSRLPVLVLGRSAPRAQALAAQVPGVEAAGDAADLMRRCDVVALAVSDDALEAVIADLGQTMTATGAMTATRSVPFVFHVSGRSGVAPLAPIAAKGALTAAIHPAMTFTGNAPAEVRRMHGARFAITGANPAATDLARKLVDTLGGVPVIIAEAHRALYHAALCHAANHLVTLIAGSSHALVTAGVEDPAGLLAPLVRAALDNSLTHGFAALSGPVLRGDSATIGQHLDAMAADCPALLPAYCAMARATLDELERSGQRVAPELLTMARLGR